MKAYSLDLRRKIIETYENEPISQRQLAERFRVALSFITKLLKQYRETGDLMPKQRSGRPRLLNDEQLEFVQKLVEAQNDMTLSELCNALEQRLNVRVSEPTMARVIQRLNLTRKKSSSSLRSKESTSAAIRD